MKPRILIFSIVAGIFFFAPGPSGTTAVAHSKKSVAVKKPVELTTNEIIAPKSFIWRFAIAWPVWPSSPG